MNKTLFVRNQKTNEKQSKAPTEKKRDIEIHALVR